VVEGRGVRCVSTRPWVTAAETCEFVMALDADRRRRARPTAVHTGCSSCGPRAAATGSGANFDDEAFHLDGQLYPVEQPTWNSAAVVLACNALGGSGPTAGLFRGEGLPVGLTSAELIAAGEAIESERAKRDPR